jgi:hypothetical protein
MGGSSPVGVHGACVQLDANTPRIPLARKMGKERFMYLTTFGSRISFAKVGPK